jgi:hypothetical protein
VYIKQTPHEHARLRNWLVQIAEQIIGACEVNASAAEWFSQPMREFRKSQRGEYYSPEELLTDMIAQLAQGRDMCQSMVDRWNRLTAQTPWQIELVEATGPTTAVVAGSVAHS